MAGIMRPWPGVRFCDDMSRHSPTNRRSRPALRCSLPAAEEGGAQPSDRRGQASPNAPASPRPRPPLRPRPRARARRRGPARTPCRSPSSSIASRSPTASSSRRTSSRTRPATFKSPTRSRGRRSRAARTSASGPSKNSSPTSPRRSRGSRSSCRRHPAAEHGASPLLPRRVRGGVEPRAHFAAALVLGRAYRAEGDPGAAGSIDEVLAHATRIAPDEAAFAAITAKLRARAERFAHLDERDLRGFELVHKAFFKGQLDTRFSLKQANGRLYPSIGELLPDEGRSGDSRGASLASARPRSEACSRSSARAASSPWSAISPATARCPASRRDLERARDFRPVDVLRVERRAVPPSSRRSGRSGRATSLADADRRQEPLRPAATSIRARSDPLEMKGHRTATGAPAHLGLRGSTTRRSRTRASFWRSRPSPSTVESGPEVSVRCATLRSTR